jgi:type IV pilus assembly protein PilV
MIDKKDGFTLIELLVSIVILMVGLLGLLQTINFAMSTNVENFLRNEALVVASDKMNEKRSIRFSSLYSSASNNPSLQNIKRDTRGIAKNYSTITNVYARTPKTVEVEVRVSWKYKNIQKNHLVSTVVSEIQ